jgi:hypothetical protein
VATPPPIVTAAEVSTATKGQVAANDPRLGLLIKGASAGVRRYCGWHVTPNLSETLVMDGSGGDVQTLKTLHLTAVASVTEKGRTAPLVEDVDFEWSELGSLRRLNGFWTFAYRGVTATITHGFDDADDVKQVVIQVVTVALSSPLGATREQAGALSVSWATTAPGVAGGMALLQRDLAVLDRYRIQDA